MRRWSPTIVAQEMFDVLAQSDRPLTPKKIKKAMRRGEFSFIVGLLVLSGRGWIYVSNSLTGRSSGPYTENALFGLSADGRVYIPDLPPTTN
jgi:hypothetical protein